MILVPGAVGLTKATRSRSLTTAFICGKVCFGAVWPQSGQCVALVFNHCDREVFQAFLDHLTTEVPIDPKKRRILIMDNASWHKVKSLHWHHFQPKYPPAYSPDLNPIERLCLRLKADFFSDFIARTNSQLLDRICEGRKHFLSRPADTSRLCSLRTSL